MIELFVAHPIIATIGSYYVYSAVVGGMPQPKPTSSAAYQWAFSSLHLLAGNLAQALRSRYPAFAPTS